MRAQKVLILQGFDSASAEERLRLLAHAESLDSRVVMIVAAAGSGPG
ncbi:MAG: hypothetical protein QOK05_1199 [Chloroflexota bacterium]|jgi:hypothetical protein|nr:hypothetical protein [Chloroflexota bacterium]